MIIDWLLQACNIRRMTEDEAKCAICRRVKPKVEMSPFGTQWICDDEQQRWDPPKDLFYWK